MRHSCPILILLLAARTSFGGILYNNTIDTHATSGLTGSQAYILVDDVLIPTQRDPLDLPVAITQITVLVSAAPGASGQFSMWDFPVQVNGQVVSPGLPPTLIATTQHTFTNPFEQVSFGNGSTTLFTVTPNFTADPGYGLIYLGLSASADIVEQTGNGQTALTLICLRPTSTISRPARFFSIHHNRVSRQTSLMICWSKAKLCQNLPP